MCSEADFKCHDQCTATLNFDDFDKLIDAALSREERLAKQEVRTLLHGVKTWSVWASHCQARGLGPLEPGPGPGAVRNPAQGLDPYWALVRGLGP